MKTVILSFVLIGCGSVSTRSVLMDTDGGADALSTKQTSNDPNMTPIVSADMTSLNQQQDMEPVVAACLQPGTQCNMPNAAGCCNAHPVSSQADIDADKQDSVVWSSAWCATGGPNPGYCNNTFIILDHNCADTRKSFCLDNTGKIDCSCCTGKPGLIC